jgi:leader peptidase (prepilin peptidase)/N-methyltransferase
MPGSALPLLPALLAGTAVFLLGAILGSFLNVVIRRLPAGESVVRPGSHCRCGEPLPWHDNLPLLSWFHLRGRARCCGRRISARYPLVEGITAVLFLLCWWLHPPGVALSLAVLVLLLVPAFWIDLDHLVIPDLFTVGGMLLGLFFSVLVPGLHGFLELGGPSFRGFAAAFVGALVGSAVYYWLAVGAGLALRREALGEGDIKLAGCLGAFLGWQGAVFALFGGALLGTVLLLPVLAWQRFRPGEGEGRLGAGSEIPFGPFLIAAALAYAFGLQGSVDAWFAEVGGMLSLLP